jgi:hypothetical protein
MRRRTGCAHKKLEAFCRSCGRDLGPELVRELERLRADLAACRDGRAADLRQKRMPCPCLHTEPCHPRCTCRSPASSAGCRRCSTYGSPEQQKAKAEWLARAIDGYREVP